MASLFTKKHYEAIARVVGHLPDPAPLEEVEDVFARMFAFDNPHFQRHLFAQDVAFYANAEPPEEVEPS